MTIEKIQDFSNNISIDWNKPILAIDAQLYKKYNLSFDGIAFIESMINLWSKKNFNEYN